MSKDDTIYLRHILDAIKDIENFTKGVSEEKFGRTKLLQDAVIRNLEIIGEASKRVPKKIKDKHKDIEWKKIAGMRDVLIHDYLGVDVEIVWAVIENRLPELKKKIAKILNQK